MSVVAFAVWNDLFWSAVVMFATFCNYNQQPSLDYPSSSSPITKTPSLHGSVTQSFLVNTVRYHQSSIANLIFSCYFFISSNLIYQKNLQSVNDQQITMSQSPDLQPLMQDILPSTKTDSQQLHPKGSNAPTGEDEHCWWFVRNPVIKLTSWGEVGSWSHYLQGVLAPSKRWLGMGISEALTAGISEACNHRNRI